MDLIKMLFNQHFSVVIIWTFSQFLLVLGGTRGGDVTDPYRRLTAHIPGHGDVYFSQGNFWDTRWFVNGNLENLTPNQLHGMHVHELGTIESGCGGAGGHYNPHQVKHGGREAVVRHVGDLGNIQADASGTAIFSFTDFLISKDISGRALVIHTGEDDLGWQATLRDDSLADSLIGKDIAGRALVIHTGEDDLGLGGDAGSMATGNAGGRLGCGVIVWETRRPFIRLSTSSK